MTPPKEISQDDIYDLVAGLSYSGFLSDRITFEEAEKKIKDFLANYSLKADGLQFVKASERLPDKIYNYHVRKISTFSGDIYNDTSFWNGFEFEKKYVGESDKIIEWLDYSLKADCMQWVKADIKPDFDGEYLCDIEQTQECGNVWKYYGVRSNAINNWVIKYNETVIRWAKIPPPDESGESSSKITELEKEIERLKGLIESAFRSIYNITYKKEVIDAKWQQFKKYNNL